MRRFLAIVFSTGAVIAGVAVGTAAAAEGELATWVHYGPRHLSIGQHWTGSSQPSAERELQIELDRDLAIQVKGVPGCTVSPSLQTGVSVQEACAGAQVGSGEETIGLAFPGSAPVEVPGKVQIYNGGEHKGAIALWLHGTFPAPLRSEVLTKLIITRIHNSRLGWLLDAPFPQLASGSGSITDLDLKLARAGVFSTRCLDGKLEANARVGFEDGTAEERRVVQACGWGSSQP